MRSNLWILSIIIGILFGENYLNVSDVTANPGDSDIAVHVYFSNLDIVAGIQFTLHLDTNFVHLDTVIQGERIVGTSMQLSYNNMGDSIKIVIISLSGDSLLPDSGELLTFHFGSGPSVTSGDSVILSLSNVAISSPQAASLPVSYENGVIRFIYQPRAFLILGSDTVMAGELARIPLILDNPEDAVSGMQFTLIFNGNVLSFDTLLSNLPNTFSYSYNVFQDSVKFLILSFSGDSLSTGGDTIGTLKFSVSNTVTPDDSLGITVENLVLSNPQASPIPATGYDGFIGVSTAPPEILFPNGYLDTRIFYTSWRSVTAASLYQIELSNRSNFSVVIDSGSTGDTTWISSVDFDGVIFARVRSITYRGYRSQWSNVDTFIVDITPPPVPILSSPINNGLFNNESIPFDWNDVEDTTSGIAGYWIEISTDSSFVDSYFVSVSETTIILSDTIYYWRVKAVDRSGNESYWSDIWSFTIDTEVPPTPTLISPIGGVWLTSDTVTFQWSEVTKVLWDGEIKSTPVRYIIEILQGGDVVIYDTVDTNGYTAVLNEGKYHWRVKAFDLASNESDWSNYDSMGIDITPPSTVFLYFPGNGALINHDTLLFVWHPAIDYTSGICGYYLQLSTTPYNFSDSIFVPDTSYPIFLSDTTWFWRVKAMDNAGLESRWSETWMLTIDTRAPETPELISPGGGVWLNDTTVTLEWSEASKFVSKGSFKATPVHYVVEVLDDTMTMVNDTVDTNRLEIVLVEDWYRWHVMAFDDAGNESDWSPVDSFGVDITSPIIDSMTMWNDTSMFFGPYEVNVWAEDSLSGIGGAWLFYAIDSDNFDSLQMIDSAGVWVGEIPILDDSSSHSISYFVDIWDRAQPKNETTSDTITFTIHTIPSIHGIVNRILEGENYIFVTTSEGAFAVQGIRIIWYKIYNGEVYAVRDSNFIYLLEPNGKVLRISANNLNDTTVLVVNSDFENLKGIGNTYLFISSTSSGILYAVNKSTGEVGWSYHYSGYINCPVIFGDTIYIGGSSGYLKAIAGGYVLWATSTSGCYIHCKSADSSTIYFTDGCGYLNAVNRYNGNIIYSVNLRHGWLNSLTLEDTIGYTINGGGIAISVDLRDGHIIWTSNICGDVNKPPYIGENYLYFSCTNDTIYAVDKNNGEVINIYDAYTGYPYSPLIIIANDTMYVSGVNSIREFPVNDGLSPGFWPSYFHDNWWTCNFYTNRLTDVSEPPPTCPKEFKVGIYPNPVNVDGITLKLGLPKGHKVDIRIYDVSGREVWGLSRYLEAGYESIPLRIKSSGVYIVVVKMGPDLKRRLKLVVTGRKKFN